ncbi:hypothetical protein PROFUN_12360 [Planoprotostelium fungivorum]|uniref:DUF985 domain-containing protein n=1 Tax=Planoprotostelium fungivorum TaxID=1890364 RepID=A0A2P6N9F7_9EUKA|nr:hypothetical protein PROFUN_12360 [Planoprotostelium fungivorum]
MEPLYHYPRTNEQLIEDHKLEPHPENGFFSLTWIASEEVSSPLAEDKRRKIGSSIYYLLSLEPNSSIGVLHLNKSHTMHLHHCGRTKYTLISALPPLGQGLRSSRGGPLIKRAVMGEDTSKGEVRQLMVEGGWWKVSEIPKEDREAVREGRADGERVGALISEVVMPAFDWEDHTFMTQEQLVQLFHDQPAEKNEYLQYIHRPSPLE